MQPGRKGRSIPLTLEERNFRLDSWIERHEVVEESAGPEWVLSCPKCGRTKLAVHVYRKAWQCWRCGFAGWNPTVLVAELQGISRAQAAEIIASQSLGDPVGLKVEPLAIPERRSTVLPLASTHPTVWHLEGPQHAYIASRGVSEEMMHLLRLGTILDDQSSTKANRSLAGRIVFPAWDGYGRFVFWQARASRPDQVKTMNYPRSCRTVGHPPDCVCYHEEWGIPPVPRAATADEAIIGLNLVQKGERCVVVEGPVDVAVCGPGFVSPMGAKLSEYQAMLIAAREPSEVIILFDGDQGGRKALEKSINIMSAYVPTRGTTCPDGTDPGDLGRDNVVKLINNIPKQSLPDLQKKIGPTWARDELDQSPPFLPPLTPRG